MMKLALAFALGVAAVSLWWRKNPSACPYSQRFWVEAPHPFITRERLLETLRPKPDERILEIGPGTGYYSLPVAEKVQRLDLVDVQPDFLDHTLRRAEEHGLTNLVPNEADARELPFEDATFDAAYLVTVLGEIPDQDRALRELARVTKPGGRVVVGELFGDPHWVAPGKLRERGERAGLRYDTRVGPAIGSFTRFYFE
jgi:ubiquinone/menaquinone biosynthesis C-methylase UbiE